MSLPKFLGWIDFPSYGAPLLNVLPLSVAFDLKVEVVCI